jgi:hypothetical protein
MAFIEQLDGGGIGMADGMLLEEPIWLGFDEETGGSGLVEGIDPVTGEPFTVFSTTVTEPLPVDLPNPPDLSFPPTDITSPIDFPLSLPAERAGGGAGEVVLPPPPALPPDVTVDVPPEVQKVFPPPAVPPPPCTGVVGKIKCFFQDLAKGGGGGATRGGQPPPPRRTGGGGGAGAGEGFPWVGLLLVGLLVVIAARE